MKTSPPKQLLIVVSLVFLFNACMNSSGDGWSAMVPQETSFVIVPPSGATVSSVIESEHIPLLEDISASAIPVVTEIDSVAGGSLGVQSILLYPGTNQKLQPIWITDGSQDLQDQLGETYRRAFTQNEYDFHDITIRRLQIQNRQMFTARFNNRLLISESSRGIENAIRTYRGQQAGAGLATLNRVPGSLIMNTPALDQWLMQFTRVAYNPALEGALQGTGPALLTVSSRGDDAESRISLTGEILLEGEESPLIRSVTTTNGPITLDGYVSSNAAAFSILHHEPTTSDIAVPADTSATDQYLLENEETVTALASSLASEFGMVMYSESGFLSSGEYLFLRKLDDVESFRNQLERLSQRNLVNKSDGIYFVNSPLLAGILGSPLCDFPTFYVNIVDEAAVISKRRGLAAMVASDRSRRRVITYEPAYEKVAEDFPETMSSLFVAGPEFAAFMEPFLNPDHYLDALTSSYNYLSLTTRLNDDGDRLAMNLSAIRTAASDQPFRENWIYNTGGAELSGPPAFGDFRGSPDDEVVAATRTGSIYVFSSDGTRIQQMNTGSDVPVGSPVIHDWYGTGKNVILIAAGNKIYGWDENGETLPKFPFELSESITTPLSVGDINNNRIPDALVGTADRRLHVLNGRGNNLAGWPVTTNAPVTASPYTGYFRSVSAVVAFTSNAVHAWNAAGDPLPGFPVFTRADFRGGPALLEDAIIGGAVDGNLYGVGEDVPFADSLNVYDNSSRNSESAVTTKAVYVANSPLTGTPRVSEEQVLATSRNGSVFLMNPAGVLQLTKSMGQPAAEGWSSRITDIDGDNQNEIVALADYGRLYAWRIPSGERLFNLPTASMRHVQIGDLDGDGLQEVVAQTGEGIQCWTINR